MRAFSAASFLIAAAGVTSGAWAQHASFVLFGQPNEAAASATVYEKAVHPISSPYHHEDAFITSDVRAWFAYHDFPSDIALGGGHAMTAAVQARLALTDRLQLVAYKDGYLWIDTPAMDEDGWVDVAAGLKYAIVQDFESQFHWAAGGGYEIALGDEEVLQDDDEFRVWTSVNKGFDRLHLGGVVNYFVAPDSDEGAGNSDRLSWHLHLDYAVCEWFSPVLEINGFHVTDAGTSTLPFHGADVLNLGTGAGDPVITMAPGFEVRPMENLGLRAAFEFPLTDNEDIYGSRLTLSAVYSF
jgi:hypothetical protein